jgi:DNA-binding MarR family transcriptional regulator
MTDPQELARLVAEFGKAYTRWIWSEMERAGTTPARARLLMALQCRGSCTMGALGSCLGVTPRNVTKLVDGLEGEGLVLREPHPYDRRATLLRLTDKGVLVCKESALANHAAVAHLYEQLGPADRQHLARILRKLLHALGAKGFGPPAEVEGKEEAR